MEDARASSSSSSSSEAMTRRASYRALGSLSPRSAAVSFSLEPPCEEEARHFLDACHLCRRPLGFSRDIFMYRGDTPFCSEECRQEQIDLDLAREEEEAGYWRSRRRHQRVREPSAAPAASQVQVMPAPAAHTVLAG